MSESRNVEEKFGTTLASLTERLTSVKGGRLILALAVGALELVPYGGAAVVEYKNLYASAATNERLAQLVKRVDYLAQILKEYAIKSLRNSRRLS